MAGCYILLHGCGGSGVSTLGSCAGGCAGAWGTSVFKMTASCLRAVACLSPRCGMGLDGVGLCRTSVRSVNAIVTPSSSDSIGKFFWTGNSSVVSDTRSDAVLGMYDVRHL